MFERFEDATRNAMVHANQIAQQLNHEYIGTEHILLGILSSFNVASIVVHCILGRKDDDSLKEELMKRLTPGPEMVIMGKLPQTPRARRVIELAVEEARRWNHNYIETCHLLIGLILEREGIAGQFLAEKGMTADQIRTFSFLSSKPSNPVPFPPPEYPYKTKCSICEKVGSDNGFITMDGVSICPACRDRGLVWAMRKAHKEEQALTRLREQVRHLGTIMLERSIATPPANPECVKEWATTTDITIFDDPPKPDVEVEVKKNPFYYD